MKNPSVTGLVTAALLTIGPASGVRSQVSIDLDNTDSTGRVTTVLSGEQQYYGGVYGLEVWVLDGFSTVPGGINGQISWTAYANMQFLGFFLAATFTNQDNSSTPGVINLGELDIPAVTPRGSRAAIALVIWAGDAESPVNPYGVSPSFGIVAFVNPTADYTAVPKPAAPPLMGWTGDLRIDLPDQLEYDYSVSGGEVTLLRSYDDAPSLTVPQWIGGLPVVSLSGGAYTGNPMIRTLTIPGGINYIGAGACGNLVNLADVFFLGNAPGVDPAVFEGDPNATAYYLPGATGWSSTFGGLPAVLWNPTSQAPGVRNNQFSFNITGATNLPIVVEASTDLTSGAWTPLQTCTLTNGLLQFGDSDWSNHPSRFYRIGLP